MNAPRNSLPKYKGGQSLPKLATSTHLDKKTIHEDTSKKMPSEDLDTFYIEMGFLDCGLIEAPQGEESALVNVVPKCHRAPLLQARKKRGSSRRGSYMGLPSHTMTLHS